MKTIAPLFSTLLAALTLSGQSTFNRNYGLPDPDIDVHGGHAIEVAGSLYFVAARWDIDTNLKYLWLQALDEDGNELFSTYLTDTARGYVQQKTEIVPSGTGLVVTGERGVYSFADTIIPGFLVRYDLAGDTVWTRQVVIADTSYNIYYLYGLTVNAEGQIVAAGTTTHDDTWPYNDVPGQIYVIKTDSMGNTIWENVYGQIAANETTYDVEYVPSDKGYMVVGLILEYYSAANALFTPFVLRLDSNGTQVHYTEINAAFSHGVGAITLLGDGNYVLAGASCTDNSFQYDGCLTKIDTSGTVLWHRVFPGRADWTHDELSDVVELPTGDLIVSGYGIDTSDMSQCGWVIKTDAQGYLLWERYINFNNSVDYFIGITALSDGGILAAGNCFDTVGWSNQVWMVKLDSLGCDSSGCPQEYHTGMQNLRPIDGIYLVAAPNPFREGTEIRWAWPAFGRKCQLLIHDMQGRELLRKVLDPNVARGVLHFEAPGAGAYVASLVADGRVVQAIKLVAE